MTQQFRTKNLWVRVVGMAALAAGAVAHANRIQTNTAAETSVAGSAIISPEVRSSTPMRELWVTQMRDSKISVLSFPEGEVQEEICLSPGTQPHITTFYSGAYAYISGLGNGTLSIVDANSLSLVETLKFAPAAVHQGKVSPDGTTMLVSVLSTQMVHKVAVDEAKQSWMPVDSVSFAPLEKRPVCAIFRADSQRAYVSTLPDGIVIVDVPSMAILGTLNTDGFIACGMIKPSADADHAVIAASGGGGHIYTLDMTNDTLVDRGTLGAASWHSFIMTPDESLGFGSSPDSDEVVMIDLTTDPVTNLGTLLLEPLPGSPNNQPDAMGGGEVIVDGTLPVSLRAAGQVALVDVASPETKTFVEITDPSPPGTFDPMTCIGCSVHGIAVRPIVERASTR
jgi:hypothetical protein